MNLQKPVSILTLDSTGIFVVLPTSKSMFAARENVITRLKNGVSIQILKIA